MMMWDRIMIENKVIPEAQMPIKDFVRLHPGMHQACQTFTFCEDKTQNIINRAIGTVKFLLKENEAIIYLETLIKLYCESGEIEQAAALIRLKKELGLSEAPEQMRL